VESSPEALSAQHGVELVAWPRESGLRASLARAGVPRLLVLDEGVPPPTDLAQDEDWIRAPFEPADLRARARRIAAIVAERVDEPAWIDDQRVVHRGPRTAVLTASEAVVADALLASPGQVVSRAALESRLWPGSQPPSSRAIDAIVYRLRRRFRELGLMIRSARGEGFVLLGLSDAI